MGCRIRRKLYDGAIADAMGGTPYFGREKQFARVGFAKTAGRGYGDRNPHLRGVPNGDAAHTINKFNNYLLL